MAGGIGASWHAIETAIPVVGDRSHGGSGWGGYPGADDASAWSQIYHHAQWLGLDFCRVELEQRIYEPEREKFTWESEEMRILYRILDFCEKRKADVFLQQRRKEPEHLTIHVVDRRRKEHQRADGPSISSDGR